MFWSPLESRRHDLAHLVNDGCYCCCQVASVVSDSVRPHRWQPTRLPHPWDSPGKNKGKVAIAFSNAWKWKVKLKLLSHARLLATPWTAAHKAPPSMGFSRREYWSGVPLPSPVHEREKWKWSHSVMPDSQRPHGLQPTRLLCPWDFPGKSTGVGCRYLQTNNTSLFLMSVTVL